MGQYYEVILKSVTDEFKLFSPIEYDGNKLMEFSWFGSNIANQICKELLYTPQRVYVVGDYAEDSDNKNPLNVFNVHGNLEYKVDFLRKVPEVKYTPSEFKLDQKYYVVNITKGLRFELKEGIFKLFLLCSIGNGQGGGDYRGVSENEVGTWYGDIIKITTETAIEQFLYTDYDVEFEEC